MAGLNDKYGRVVDIETKPEWETMRRMQDRLLRELHELTDTAEDILFENLQHALVRVLGNEVTTLDQRAAKEVVAETVRLSVRDELVAARVNEILN